MKLKKLELFGFKSFADKTAVEFHDGVTGVVGPNGCGKSNIVDAFKWILGEQSAKSLRGTEMLDVIFNGTRERKALGFAEASLVFTGVRDTLNCDRDEVRISRRLWRSGESEYMIDGKNCRLRDVRELFMDTGIGKEAYSVIEQGKIDALLNSNSKERRAVFEEAAGITRYKAKKMQAERTLERVDNRLEVLRVKIETLETQVRSLRIQAGRAKKHMEYTRAISALQTEEALHNYHAFTNKMDVLSKEISQLKEEKRRFEVEYEKLEAEVTEKQARFLDIGENLRQTESAVQEQESVLRVSAERRKIARDRIDEFDRELERLSEMVTELNRQKRELEAEFAAAERDLAGHGDRVGSCRDSLVTARREYADVSAELRSALDLLEAKKAEHLALLDSRAESQNRLMGVNVEKRGLTVRKERCDRRREELEAKLTAIAIHRREVEGKTDLLRGESDGLNEKTASVTETLTGAETIVKELGSRIVERRREEERISSRRDVLLDLMEKGESYERGTRTVIERAAGTPDAFPGLAGVVADLIDVDSEHAAAVEGALGRWAGALVVENEDAASGIIAYLRTEEGGRAPFIVLSRVTDENVGARHAVPLQDTKGMLSSFIRVAPEYEAAIEWLLKDDYLADGDAEPNAFLGANTNGARFVTSDGEIYGPGALAYAGNGAAHVGPLVAKAEAAELGRKLEAVRAAIAYDESTLSRAKVRAEQSQREMARLQVRMQDVKSELAAIDVRRDTLTTSLQEVESESDVIRREVNGIDNELASLAVNESSLSGEISEFRRKETELHAETRAVSESARALEQEKDKKLGAMSELEVEAAQLIEKERALAARRNHVRLMLEEKGQHIAGALRDEETVRSRRDSCENTVASEERNIREAIEEKQELEAEAARLSDSKAELQGTIEVERQESRARAAELKKVEENLSEFRMKETRVVVQRDDLIMRFREEHDIDLAARYAGYADSEKDWEAVHKEIVTLKQKLHRLGNVNLEAIDQLDAQEAELEREKTQEADLLAARKKLIETIRRVNATSTKMFMETFESVRVHFQELFKKLFGRTAVADIYLADPTDPLESGIEIKARPPGKQLRHISLLSGGEKVMTTVALLFAIFRSKPSPFCILDEVDAALDDTNIRRFTDMLGTFLDRSQFLVITHNKQTMTVCDVLYGVTMQEPGVSKKISVDLEHRVA